MWIADGEKYALVGLEVKLEGTPPPEQVTPNLWVLTATTFNVPPEWWEWLGSIRAHQVAGSNLFLLSKLASATPDILDGQNQSLQVRVRHFYVGLLLSVMFSPSHKPVMLTGARGMVRLVSDSKWILERPAPQVFRPYPSITADEHPVGGAARTEARCDAAGDRAERFVAALAYSAHIFQDASDQ